MWRKFAINSNKKGFTVIEVMLVMLILALLAVFGFAKAAEQIQKAEDVAAQATLGNLNSVYRVAHLLLLTENQDAQKGLFTLAKTATHIPRREGEAAHAYVRYMERQILLSFSQNAPVYEITVTTKGHFIAYWPKPEKKPSLCYVLASGGVKRTTQTQPQWHKAKGD